MNRQKMNTRRGLTLVELMTVIAMMAILVFAVAVTLADNQKSFNTLYNRANKGMRVDAVVARESFEATVRKSTSYCDVAADGSYAQVYYYHNPTMSTRVDGYTKFYVVNRQLKADYGSIAPFTWIPTNVAGSIVLANNVQSVLFRQRGDAVDMILVLNDGRGQLTVASSAMRNNK